MRVVSFVCAALGAGSLVSACGAPAALGVPALAGAPLPAVVDGRKTRLTFTLPNGVTAILEENHVAPVVALQAWIAAGSRAEEAGQGGLAHLTERVVLAGARADADPAPLAAWTSFDEAVFETVVAAPAAPARLDELGAMLARGAFEGAEIERARADVVGELRRAAASPAAVARDALFTAAFRGHGYGRPVLGDEAALRALTAADVTAFHARAYAGARVTLVAVGDFDARALRARVASAFAALPKGSPATEATVEVPASHAVVVAAVGDGDVHLAIGLRFSARDASALASVDVLAATLAHGRGEEGRLVRELVRNRQLGRDVRVSVFRGPDVGVLVLDVSLVSGRAAEAARVVLDEVAGARRELGRGELEVAAAAVEADLARAQETPAGYARKLGLSQLLAGTPASEDRYLGALRALAPEDVRAATASLLLPAAISVAVAGPGPARRDLAAELDAVVAGLAAKPARGVESRAVTSAGGVVRVVLPSGVRVLVLRDPAAASVAAHALWSGGLRLEDARTNGVTSLLAATLPRGTRTRDAARLASALDAVGGTLSASAGRDELGVSATFLARRWEAGLALLADCLRHPAFDEVEVEAALRAALERVRDHEDDADVAAARLYAATLWPGHPYRLPLLGTASSLSGLTRRRLVDHFQAHYGAANLTIAVVGDVDAGRVVEELSTLLADAPPALVPPPPAATPSSHAADAPTEVFAVASRDQAHAVVGYPGLSLADPDRRAADVLVEILGGREDGRDGRLARDLAGRSLVGASAWSGLDGGALVFDLASTPANLDDAVVALRAALGHVFASPFSAAEVERARSALASADARALGRRGAVAAALARQEALGLGTFARRAAALDAVTPDAVARVAHRLLDPRLEIVAVARPPLAPTIAKAAAPKAGGRAGAPPASTATPNAHSGGRRPPAP